MSDNRDGQQLPSLHTALTYPTLPHKLILTSTKAYFSPTRTLQYLDALLLESNSILPLNVKDNTEGVFPGTSPSKLLFALIPDFLTLYPCAQILTSRYGPPSAWPLSLGAQDCFWEKDYGAYTGEIVPSALASLGVSIVELGHAERRDMLAETNETTAKKAAAVSACGMVPLVCVGELQAPDENGPMSASVGKAVRELTAQVESVLRAVPSDAPVILAYEPVWAIGATQPAEVDYVGAVVQAIREIAKAVKTREGRRGQTKVVYGGSAGPGLWSGQMNGGKALSEYVDGMFLGRFAHDVDGVKKVVDEVIQSL